MIQSLHMEYLNLRPEYTTYINWGQFSTFERLRDLCKVADQTPERAKQYRAPIETEQEEVLSFDLEEDDLDLAAMNNPRNTKPQ